MILSDSTTLGHWNKPILFDLQRVYLWERHTAYMLMSTQSHWMHTCMEGISACLRFEASLARAACVTKSHSQRAFYPPRLRGSWHWQRMHTQRHIHKHNLHAWCNAQSVERTDTFGYMKQHCSVSALISVTLLLHFGTCLPLHIQWQEGGFCFPLWFVTPVNCCLCVASFRFFFSSFLLLVWQWGLSHWRPI